MKFFRLIFCAFFTVAAVSPAFSQESGNGAVSYVLQANSVMLGFNSTTSGTNGTAVGAHSFAGKEGTAAGAGSRSGGYGTAFGASSRAGHVNELQNFALSDSLIFCLPGMACMTSQFLPVLGMNSIM